MIELYKLKRFFTRDRLLLQFTHPPRPFYCVICGRMRIMIRTDRSPRIGTRCLSCHSTAHHRGVFQIVRNEYGADLQALAGRSVYELSAHGSLFHALKARSELIGFTFQFSEYFEDCEAGSYRNGTRCEDIERLTFDDDTFDLVTSTGVMEHVEHDVAGFAEIFRVLRNGGRYLFTVPFSVKRKETRVRATRKSDNSIQHLHPPEFHGDPFRGEGGVFTWRNYGVDLLDRLQAIGFDAEVREVPLPALTDPMPVIHAVKP